MSVLTYQTVRELPIGDVLGIAHAVLPGTAATKCGRPYLDFIPEMQEPDWAGAREPRCPVCVQRAT